MTGYQCYGWNRELLRYEKCPDSKPGDVGIERMDRWTYDELPVVPKTAVWPQYIYVWVNTDPFRYLWRDVG